MANGTLGLMIALRALTSEHNAARLVVTPSYTFAATALAITWAGFTPLFVDIDATTWHVDPASLLEAIEKHGDNVAAVLLCSTFGAAPSVNHREAWEQICRDARLPLLIDSAAGWGSRDEEDRPLGLQGDAEVFSFHATKAMAIGEGGAIVTRHGQVQESVRRLANFGFDDTGGPTQALGLNAKMSEIHAAAGLAMLDQLDRVVTARQQFSAALGSRIEPLGFSFQPGAERSAWSAVHALASTPEVRDAALSLGARRQIEFRSYYDPPLHRTQLFALCPRVDDLQATDEVASRALSIPIANGLGDSEITALAECLGSAVVRIRDQTEPGESRHDP